ncbi:MAG TPA: hypothetical protein VFJ24_11875 [Gaiellales bacterium]|nr:hypothetical protein [Gaiellales bacterium]
MRHRADIAADIAYVVAEQRRRSLEKLNDEELAALRARLDGELAAAQAAWTALNATVPRP